MGILNFFRPKPIPRIANAKGMPRKPKYKKRKLSPEEFTEWKQGASTTTLPADVIRDPSKLVSRFMQELFKIPIVSGSIWAWKWIVFTKGRVVLKGGTDKRQEDAMRIIDAFNQRVFSLSFVQGSGISLLIEQFFQAIFSNGRFATNTILNNTATHIERVEFLDPFKIYFKKTGHKFTPYFEISNDKAIELNQKSFFYYGLNMSFQNPYGWAMIESSPTFLDMTKEMVEDLRLTSHNAGLPRLHFKISQPPILESESNEDYESRINSYFDNTIKEFAEIGPDDNFYTWDDVEIGMAGGQAGPGGFVWSTNHAAIQEEIITAFHLYPWILGKSASTTKNWVTAQYNLILNQADSFQQTAQNYIDWLLNIELMLHGLHDVRASYEFERPRDPQAKDLAIAERFNITNTNTLVRSGYISSDAAARRLGLPKAYDSERIYKQQKIGKTTKEVKGEE
jgi:hypothetical protein